MNLLESLLSVRWVLKSENKELYYQIRDNMGSIRPFATEKLGCQIIENSLLVKLEKIPAKAEPFMGIQEFTSREEYAYLCVLLMFLEDKETQEQFILSQLTEYIKTILPGETANWTLYTNRRRLVKVLRFAAGQGMMKVTDGSDEKFMDTDQGEVLYENTGASRYFMRNFARDITEYQSPEDFAESEWFRMNEDRGLVRRHRVYKKLLFSVGMYREGAQDEDFEYLKYYGKRLSEDLEHNFDVTVHIHKGSAYVLLGENSRMGTVFPGNNVLSDILLLCCREIRRTAETEGLFLREDEKIIMDFVDFGRLLRRVKEKYGAGFTKEYREMTEHEFTEKIAGELQRWNFIDRDSLRKEVVVYPAAGKIQAHYPADFLEREKKETKGKTRKDTGKKDEQQMAGK